MSEEGLESFDPGFAATDLVPLLEETQDGQPMGGYLPGVTLQGEEARRWLGASLSRMLPLLGRWVTEPLTQRLRGRVARIVLIPAGPLALLPWHAASDGLLLEAFTLSHAPNARSLTAALRSRRAREGSPSFMGVGNPLPHPAPLQVASAEVETIASLFPAGELRVLTGPAATRAAVLDALEKGTHVHFACHGFFDLEKPLTSRLELAGGNLLTLQDLLDRPECLAQARLAVLSACQSTLRDFHDLPDELIGLPAAFMEAGVPGVVGTLWPVDDLSTALLMVRFYGLCLLGEPNEGQGPLAPAEALRRAQLWLRGLTTNRLTQYFREQRLYPQTASSDLFGGTAPRWPPTLLAEALSRFSLLETHEAPFADPYSWAAFLLTGV